MSWWFHRTCFVSMSMMLHHNLHIDDVQWCLNPKTKLKCQNLYQTQQFVSIFKFTTLHYCYVVYLQHGSRTIVDHHPMYLLARHHDVPAALLNSTGLVFGGLVVSLSVCICIFVIVLLLPCCFIMFCVVYVFYFMFMRTLLMYAVVLRICCTDRHLYMSWLTAFCVHCSTENTSEPRFQVIFLLISYCSCGFWCYTNIICLCLCLCVCYCN